MFGKKKQQRGPEISFNPALEKEFNLLENFSTLCINKCIPDDAIEKDFLHGEKICVAKCLDRGFEYLRILQNSRI